MKGDFTRDTFDAARHYQRVLMQQGRVQLDADWNESAAVGLRRDETTTLDLVGDCGGPIDHAAFGIVTASASLPADQKAAWFDPQTTAERNAIDLALLHGDFLLMPGRYYARGRQCELENPVRFTGQPDRLDVPALATNDYVVYLDVWNRHVTALEDPDIREPVLGGPDTATRVKTVWQVRALPLAGGIDANDPRGSGQADLDALVDPMTARLTADTETAGASDDACLVPPGSGYTGLENELYRVEIHEGGAALEVDPDAGTFAATLPDAAGDATLDVSGGAWAVGDTIEVFAGKAGRSRMTAHFGWIVGVAAQKLTLDRPVKGLVQGDEPRVRKVTATWKWSRENGSVVTRVNRIDGRKLSVDGTGPDQPRGFAMGDWVELFDDLHELEAQTPGATVRPGQLAIIANVTGNEITLGSDIVPLAPALVDGVAPSRHPRLRRWEGVRGVVVSSSSPNDALPLEYGIIVRFDPDGEYRRGHYWQIPARTATATSPNGDVQWPRSATNERVARPPLGIEHHICRLGTLKVVDGTAATATDCRCLFPSVTGLPRIFYVSGDGQEVMPDVTRPADALFKLPFPLVVGIPNAQCLDRDVEVQFEVLQGMGKVAVAGQPPGDTKVSVPIGPDGLASCDFHLDGQNWAQQVEAHALDEHGLPISLPIRFDAFLNLAENVAYRPGDCGALQGQTTVQQAIDRLARLCRIERVGGDGQDADPGIVLALPLEVCVTSACGPIRGAQVTFTPDAGGRVAGAIEDPAAVGASTFVATTGDDGIAACRWLPATTPTTQQLVAAIDPAAAPTEEPAEVRFTANLRAGQQAHACCCVTVGLDGEFATLADALELVHTQKRTSLCICLMAGDHPTTGVGVAPGRLFDLRIIGCGPASRLVLDNGQKFVFTGLASLTLRDFSVEASGASEPIQILGCGDVTIERCSFRSTNVLASLVVIDGHGPTETLPCHVTLRDSTFESWFYWWIPDPCVLCVRTIPGLELGAVRADVGGHVVGPALDEIAKRVVEAKPAQRQELMARMTGPHAIELISEPFRIEALAAARLLMQGLSFSPDVRSIMRLYTYGNALVIENSPDLLTIEDCVFDGHVHLFGRGAAIVQNLTDVVGSVPWRLRPGNADWQLSGNRFLDVRLDARVAGQQPLVDMPLRVRFHDNTAQSTIALIGSRIDGSHNQFEDGLVGAWAGQTAVIVGNSGTGHSSLFAAFDSRVDGLNASLVVIT